MKSFPTLINLCKELWPLNRSLTGKGTMQTLSILKKYNKKLKIKNFATGKKCYDWIVPQTWNVKEAFITSPDNKKICDYKSNNLHLVGYSIPFKGDISLDKLKEHLYTLPEQPNAIPYITSYYEERWGFCLTQEEFDTLENGTYKVVIDSSLFDGELNYGELLIKGKSDKEILLSTYICHPSMANNELSGPTVVTFLAKWLLEINKPEYSYRIIFIPETIGSITYLSRNYKHMKNKTIAGFNVSCVGDDRTYSYVPSRNGKTISDLIAKHVLKWIDKNFVEYSWLDRGSDERQYCSPKVDLPLIAFSKSREYPEYHTDKDDFKVVTKKGLDDSLKVFKNIINVFETSLYPKTNFTCEPNMGKRNLYPTISQKGNYEKIRIRMNIIASADGKRNFFEISSNIGEKLEKTFNELKILKKNKIIF